jgi:hypothetical protein
MKNKRKEWQYPATKPLKIRPQGKKVLPTTIYFNILETVPFFHLFTREGDI